VLILMYCLRAMCFISTK